MLLKIQPRIPIRNYKAGKLSYNQLISKSDIQSKISKKLFPERLARPTRPARPAIQYHPKKIGLVIGTYGSPAYIQLHLETARRLYPHIPIIIHDDCSNNVDLPKICEQYGVKLFSTPTRRGHTRGDLSAMICGLKWASENNFDILIKMSRRFIPLINWTNSLTISPVQPTYHSQSFWSLIQINIIPSPALVMWGKKNYVKTFVIGFVIPNLEFMDYLKSLVKRRNIRVIEKVIGKSRIIKNHILWEFFTDRNNAMWKDRNTPNDYYRLSRLYGLNWGINDFLKNQ